ncbi:MAG: acetylglutamate kinase [Betaproteobacteria bacterium TMED41]|mgnify:CR=1 FL=1|nr:MAG: acetylglutamate kinase [Betaproteobacteria bacterium TMED41]|tara:strand:+ start:3222 stop:4133 length:912 start_codon:yes stop_codon:yes gene_type:complete
MDLKNNPSKIEDSIQSKIKAVVLSQALPYIKKFNGKTIIIKLGGNVMSDENLKSSFAHDVTWLKSVGINPVVIHGGGPQIETHLAKLGKEAEFFNGFRVTDAETMDVVEMVLAGKVNKELVELINQSGGRAVGLTGQDGNLIRAKKMLLDDKNKLDKEFDIGHVGNIEKVDPKILLSLTGEGFIPVIAPIATGIDGETYNINADVVAGKLAEVLQAEKLVLITNTPGVLDAQGNLITGLTAREIAELIKNRSISGGMLPKIASALEASKSGVESVHIIDGRVSNCLLLEVLTDQGVGTMIKSH